MFFMALTVVCVFSLQWETLKMSASKDERQEDETLSHSETIFKTLVAMEQRLSLQQGQHQEETAPEDRAGKHPHWSTHYPIGCASEDHLYPPRCRAPRELDGLPSDCLVSDPFVSGKYVGIWFATCLPRLKIVCSNSCGHWFQSRQTRT